MKKKSLSVAKVKEEIGELIEAVEQDSNKIHEAADVIYHLMVYLEANDIKVDAIRRYSDSSTTTKILLNDEVIKLNAGHSSAETIKVENNAVTVTGTISGTYSNSEINSITSNESNSKSPTKLVESDITIPFLLKSFKTSKTTLRTCEDLSEPGSAFMVYISL